MAAVVTLNDFVARIPLHGIVVHFGLVSAAGNSDTRFWRRGPEITAALGAFVEHGVVDFYPSPAVPAVNGILSDFYLGWHISPLL